MAVPEGLGRLRYVVEQTCALLHQFRRLEVRWERRLDIHEGFVSLACAPICWRRLIKWTNESSCWDCNEGLALYSRIPAMATYVGRIDAHGTRGRFGS